MNETYEKISALCKERGISVHRMCLEANVTYNSVLGLKTGRLRDISDETAYRISQYFNIDKALIRNQNDDFSPGGVYTIILNLCRGRGINITQMCKELKITRSSMTELKAGRTQSLSAETTKKIARFFDVPFSFLVNGITQSELDSEINEHELKSLAAKLSGVPDAERIVLLARRTADIPDAERDRLIKLFEETIDIYRTSLGLKDDAEKDDNGKK